MSDQSASVETVWKARVALMLPLAGYVIFISESLFVRPNPTWALLLLLWASSAALLAWWIAQGGGRRLLNSLDRHAARIAIGMIAVAATVLVAVSVLQARHFAMGMRVVDTAYYSQILWNTLHGDFLSGNLNQERLYNPAVSNDFALHVSPILLAGVLPIYAVFPDFLTLLVIRDLALAAAAWPLFLLARERVGGVAGITAVILYLTNPTMIAQGFQEFTPLQLAPMPFFWALRAFVREDLGSFSCWMGIAITTREDVAITMAGFGLWALVSRRQPRWLAVGLGVPVLWWGLATLIIQPAFGRWGNNVLEIASAGGSPPAFGLYQILLGNPAWVFTVLRDEGFHYLYRLFRAVGFLGVFGGEGLVAAPALAANLVLGRISHYGVDPISRLAILPSCALVGAAVLVTSRIGRKHHWDMRAFGVIMLVLMPSTGMLDGVKDAAQEGLAVYTVWNDAGALREGIRHVPETASVAAPGYALPALANRPRAFLVPHLHMYPEVQADYLLLDRNTDRVTTNPELQEQYVRLLDRLSNSAEYELVWEEGLYFVLRRKGGHMETMGLDSPFGCDLTSPQMRVLAGTGDQVIGVGRLACRIGTVEGWQVGSVAS